MSEHNLYIGQEMQWIDERNAKLCSEIQKRALEICRTDVIKELTEFLDNLNQNYWYNIHCGCSSTMDNIFNERLYSYLLIESLSF